MFEQYTDHFWAALFAAVIFYSVWLWLRAPFLVKKFYKQHGFADGGASALDEAPFGQSVLLNQLSASNVYTGVYKNHQIAQFAAYPEDRRKFTLNKAKRKQNQAMWTVTVLHSDQPMVQFCARPTIVTAALGYVLDRTCVAFPEDEKFANRVHILADDHQSVRDAFTPSVREYLTRLDPISLESVGSVLIHMGPRQPHDVGNKFQADIDSLLEISAEIINSGESRADTIEASKIPEDN